MHKPLQCTSTITLTYWYLYIIQTCSSPRINSKKSCQDIYKQNCKQAYKSSLHGFRLIISRIFLYIIYIFIYVKEKVKYDLIPGILKCKYILTIKCNLIPLRNIILNPVNNIKFKRPIQSLSTRLWKEMEMSFEHLYLTLKVPPFSLPARVASRYSSVEYSWVASWLSSFFSSSMFW